MITVTHITAEIDRFAALQRMVNDGLADAVFYDTYPSEYWSSWEWLTEEARCWLFRAEVDGVPAGVCWLNNFVGRSSMIHFCVFSAFQRMALELGQAVLDHVWAQGEHDSVYGITPAPYRHALKFVGALGFERMGVIPNACHMIRRNRYVDGVVTILKRGR